MSQSFESNSGGERQACCFLISGDPRDADRTQSLRESLELALSFALLDHPLDLILTGAATALPQAEAAAETTPEIAEIWEFLRDSTAVRIHLHDTPRGPETPYPRLADRELAHLLSGGGPTLCF